MALSHFVDLNSWTTGLNSRSNRDSDSDRDKREHTMICIECGRPVNDVYKEFGKAGSGNIRLTRCGHCKQIADKYVEYDFIIVFLDLFLHKPQAYRHLLFNRQTYTDNWISVLIVYIFFESYIKWLRIKEYCEYTQPKSAFYYYDWQDDVPYDRYWFILITAIAEFGLYVAAIGLSVQLIYRSRYAIIKYNYLVMAIILSSFGKGFLILMMIWDYPFSFSTILIFLDTSTFKAICFVGIGLVVKVVFQAIIYLFDTSMLLCTV
ncbi:hypothetical protein SAMD00019534_074570 [Acytostelium subglobosum LB1]|uniref:hypothetical protein n=1 Tax=Acytostelium subglobosum LB1 TaxID=1410327 RepID=UPI0006449D05|nr:hypothetical protein SAMD00019534_074570 [Acytostelium subglobosum LB1]GAM24282.1 hypothetical protein SAMD00019534_074570 [Acytostelium subglobosum LB1]|eukprot:XP_012752608.1 hypothetical protein SAMD00019534_074570 [Acytostelium subglobosum LB1]